MENHFVILTIISIAALVLAVAGIAAVGLFTTESYKVYADTNDQSNVFQGENQFNNQTTNSTFSIK
jgi:hypothetical protein